MLSSHGTVFSSASTSDKSTGFWFWFWFWRLRYDAEVKVTCSICNTDFDTLNTSYAVKVVSWIEHSNGRYIGAPKHPSTPLGYAHRVCTDGNRADANDSAPTLF